MNPRLVYPMLALMTFCTVDLTAQTYTCLSAADSMAIRDRDNVIELVTATDSATVADRLLWNLPSTTASKVSIISSGAACGAAGAAYHAATNPPGTQAISRTMIVIKIGNTRYVVRDLNQRVGEFNTTVVFDKNWVRLVAWDG